MNWGRLFFLGLTVFCLTIIGASFMKPAHGQQISQQDCLVMADYAVTARSLAMEPGVTVDMMDNVLARMYATSEDAKIGLDGTRAEARRSLKSPADFAGEIVTRCMQKGGDLEAIFGKGT